MSNDPIIIDLLEKPLWQLTGKEYVALHAYACRMNSDTSTQNATTVIRITGIRALAEYLACCESTIYSLKREGVLDPAIVSRVGKNIVFDAEKARQLADDYKQKQREARNNDN